MFKHRCISLFAVLIISAGSLFAADRKALLEDAAVYAQQKGVSVDEAARRLLLEREAGNLDALLASAERETFAGLWIQHEPQFRIVVRFTDRGESAARLDARVAGGPLAGIVETRPARFSLAELEARQQESRGHAKRGGVAFNSDINVFENRVELYVLDEKKLNARLAAAKARIPDGVVVQQVRYLGGTEAIPGGSALTTCTAGFGVRNIYNGELGISTAGHCPDSQSYQGIQLPFRAEDRFGEQDVQWHSTCDRVDVSNQFDSGIGLRSVTGTVPRSNQAINSTVCKMGMTTGRTCGQIVSKSYDPGADWNATFIRVGAGSSDLSNYGDSGGPWFIEDLAYGIHHGHAVNDDTDSVYMAINYINTINVAVLTYNPGPGCNVSPSSWFQWSNDDYDDTVDFDASLSSDPDGTIVSYHWDFGDGTWPETTSSPYIAHSFQPGTTYVVTLTVTDNEGLTSTSMEPVNVCPRYQICF